MQFLQEAKVNEISELYRNELATNLLNVNDIISIVDTFSVADLTSIGISPYIGGMIESIIVMNFPIF
jgi:hypothetical protein